MDKVRVRVCSEFTKKCGGCAAYGSREVVESLSLWVKTHPELMSFVEVEPSACLGVCAKGVCAEITPKEKVIKKVTFKNLHRVKALILKRVKKLLKKRKHEGLEKTPKFNRDLIL